MIKIITTLDIVKAVARQIKGKLDAKVCIDKEQLQKYSGADNCIYIEATTLISEVATLFANKDSIIIDVSYYPVGRVDKESLYNVERIIRGLFIRSIKIDNDYMHIDRITPDIVKDEVGWRLNISIMTSIFNNLIDTTIINDEKIPGTKHIEILDSKQLMNEINLDVGEEK